MFLPPSNVNKIILKQLVLCVHATFLFNIGIDSYVFVHWYLLYFRDFGTNLKQPQINETIVITVTVGQRNGIRKILKLKNIYIYCCFCVLLSFVEKLLIFHGFNVIF